MNYFFKEVKLDIIKETLIYNLNKSCQPVDSYFEDLLINASYHLINDNSNTELGYFALTEDNSLCGYWLSEEFRMQTNEIFERIITQFSITFAYIPTGDVFFLSNGIDKHSEILKQAYMFLDSHNPDSMVRADLNLSLAGLDDIEMIKANSEDFFDNLEDDIAKEKIFLVRSFNDLVGFGVIEKGILLHQYASIGMYTIEKYRNQGIGASILIKLKDLCYKTGLKPIAGCWYYNDLSRKTLNKAGFYSNSRLLKIKF